MKTVMIISLAVGLAACGKSDPVADNAGNSAMLPAPVESNASDPTGAPPPDNSANPATPGEGATTPAAAIPAALHGRWGLTPGDCTSTKGDAKGLLVVAADRLTFYESRAVPSGNVQASADSFSADFSFTGEGQTWSRYQTLEKKGDKLVRTLSAPMESFTYARCS
jgi:hypothetical protein